MLLAVLGAALLGGFLAGAIHIHAQDPQNVSIVPVGVLAGVGLGVLLSAFTPRRRD